MTRIRLRAVLEAYPKFDKKSMHRMLSSKREEAAAAAAEQRPAAAEKKKPAAAMTGNRLLPRY